MSTDTRCVMSFMGWSRCSNMFLFHSAEANAGYHSHFLEGKRLKSPRRSHSSRNAFLHPPSPSSSLSSSMLSQWWLFAVVHRARCARMSAWHASNLSSPCSTSFQRFRSLQIYLGYTSLFLVHLAMLAFGPVGSIAEVHHLTARERASEH